MSSQMVAFRYCCRQARLARRRASACKEGFDMTCIARTSIALTLGLVLAACGSPASPPQSPTNDVQPPSTSPGDGKVIGADQVPPAQKLEQGPTLDSRDGVQPSQTPPHE
jgi:hypothetical protein